MKRAPVCEECNDRFRGTFPVSVCLLFFFFFINILCFLSSCLCKPSCPFWGCHLLLPRLQPRSPPLVFFLSISPSLSLMMSLSRCESLGYQCSASDRKCLINKLSCFSSPLYPLPFFSETRTPAASNDVSPRSTSPPPHHPSFPSLLFFPVVDGRESQVCDNNYTYTQRKKKYNVVSSI